jgi:hypothetical protein
MSEMLAVLSGLVLPPSTSPAPTPNEQLVKRVLLVETLLRLLLGPATGWPSS